MKIRRGLTGSAIYTDIQIEKACQKLLLRISGDLTILSILESFAMIVSISIKAKGGQNENICVRMPLIALFEYAQKGEGKIVLYQNATSTEFILHGEIDLAKGDAGNVFLNNNEYISVSFSECNPDWKIDLDTCETSASSMLYLKYNQSSIQEKTMTSELPNNTADTLMVRAKNTPIQAVEFTFPNNLQVENDIATFPQLLELSNDLVLVIKDPADYRTKDSVTGFLNYFILECEDVSRINISSDGSASTEIITVEHKVRPQY